MLSRHSRLIFFGLVITVCISLLVVLIELAKIRQSISDWEVAKENIASTSRSVKYLPSSELIYEGECSHLGGPTGTCSFTQYCRVYGDNLSFSQVYSLYRDELLRSNWKKEPSLAIVFSTNGDTSMELQKTEEDQPIGINIELSANTLQTARRKYQTVYIMVFTKLLDKDDACAMDR